MMNTQQTIQTKLTAGIQVIKLVVENESHQHNVPPGSESHFKVVIVSDEFEGMNLVKRHQTVYRLLTEEMSGGIHALALHTFTNSEWQQKQESAVASPACMGGSKADQ